MMTMPQMTEMLQSGMIRGVAWDAMTLQMARLSWPTLPQYPQELHLVDNEYYPTKNGKSSLTALLRILLSSSSSSSSTSTSIQVLKIRQERNLVSLLPSLAAAAVAVAQQQHVGNVEELHLHFGDKEFVTRDAFSAVEAALRHIGKTIPTHKLVLQFPSQPLNYVAIYRAMFGVGRHPRKEQEEASSGLWQKEKAAEMYLGTPTTTPRRQRGRQPPLQVEFRNVYWTEAHFFAFCSTVTATETIDCLADNNDNQQLRRRRRQPPTTTENAMLTVLSFHIIGSRVIIMDSVNRAVTGAFWEALAMLLRLDESSSPVQLQDLEMGHLIVATNNGEDDGHDIQNHHYVQVRHALARNTSLRRLAFGTTRGMTNLWTMAIFPALTEGAKGCGNTTLTRLEMPAIHHSGVVRELLQQLPRMRGLRHLVVSGRRQFVPWWREALQPQQDPNVHDDLSSLSIINVTVDFALGAFSPASEYDTIVQPLLRRNRLLVEARLLLLQQDREESKNNYGDKSTAVAMSNCTFNDDTIPTLTK